MKINFRESNRKKIKNRILTTSRLTDTNLCQSHLLQATGQNHFFTRFPKLITTIELI